MTIKVLHVRSTIGMYGAEQVILNVAQSLNSQQAETSVFAIESSGSSSSTLSALLREKNVRVFDYTSRKKLDIQLMKEIENVARNEEIHLIHTHDYKSLFSVRRAVRKLGLPVVHQIHGALGNTLNEKLYSWIEYWLMRSVDYIITVSNDQLTKLHEHFFLFPVIEFIPNGTVVNSIYREPMAMDHLNITMVARFTEEKNHSMALNIVSKLVYEGYEVQLNLLGDGPLFETIKKKAASLNLGGNVNFVGFTRDVRSWLLKSDLILFTSRTEGMPMSLIEAMACQVPVLSTPVGEIPAILQESGGGYLCNSEEEFVDKLRDIMNSRESWLEKGYKAHTYVKENYSVNSQASAFINVYRKLVNE